MQLKNPFFRLPLLGFIPESPPAPGPSGYAASAAHLVGVPEIQFEHEGWGLYSVAARTNFNSGVPTVDCDALTHIGCDCEFPNWHLSAYVWTDYQLEGPRRFMCPECEAVLPVETFNLFLNVYALLNR